MTLRRVSSEVYVADGPIAVFGTEERAMLLRELPQSRFGRLRINMHAEDASPLHEMFIAVLRGSYIHPHKHRAKSESFHLVHGELDVVLFEDDGAIRQVVSLSSQATCYYRLSAEIYHTLLIRSEAVIIHEVTDGPFDRTRTVTASFAPPAEDAERSAAYLATINERVASVKASA